MKHRLLNLTALALVACSMGLSARADYASTVLGLNPQGYWRLNETTQPPAADVAVNAGSLGTAALGYYQGTAVHPNPGALPGNSDSSAYLDGTAGSVVAVPYLPEMNPAGSFTVEAWLSPYVQNAAGTLTCAIACGQFADPRAGWLIYQSDTGWNLRFYNTNSTATSLNITGGGAPVAFSWYHVVAVYDAANTNAILYVNGVKAAEAAPVAGATQPSGSPVYVPGPNGAFYIGGRSDASFWWNGQADEVAFYNTALSSTDVSAHYSNGTSATPSTPYPTLIQTKSPLAYYRLGEGTYTPPTSLPAAVNASTQGAALNGSYNAGMQAGVEGPRSPQYQGLGAANVASHFNGVAGFVGTPFQMNDLAQFSVIGWLRRGTQHSGRGGYFGQNDLLELGDANGGASIEAWINASGGNIIVPFPFPDNQWGQFALVGDGTKTVMYANGVEVGRLTSTVTSYGNSAFNFNIGGGGIFNTAGDYFLGDIDEVAVFDKALTPEQVVQLYYAAGIAPRIDAQPETPTRTLYAGYALTLSVTADGTPALQYQWRKDGNDLSGKMAADLDFSSLTVADSGAYDVVVHNDYGSVTSAVANVTVLPADTTAPTMLYATGSPEFTKVRVWFSEPLDSTTAQTAANYQLSGGVTVQSATLSAPAGSAGDNIVDLVTTAQTPGTTYTLTVSGVKDQMNPANTIVAASTVQFSSWVAYPSHVKFEHYDNISGAADSDITKGLADPRVVAGQPTTLGYLSGSFNTRSIFPTDAHENYLARITGWLAPTETANYYIYVRSDDASRVYLSTNATLPNPATATPVCFEADCCGAFMEPGTDNATTPDAIRLEAGKLYGILVLLKEGGGGDWLELTWKKDSDPTAATDLRPLDGQYFLTYVDPNAEVSITQQPTDQAGALPTPIIDFVTRDFATGNGGFTVVNTEPTAPPGPWVYDSAQGQWAADGGEDACTGPYNSKLISGSFVVPQTDEVTLTFTHRYSFESEWDGGQVRISVNGGAFTAVPADNFTVNTYGVVPLKGNGELLNQRAFTGDSADYAAGTLITSSAILGKFNQNDTIVVQFLGAWDDCSKASQPSWVIKTMKLAYGTAPKAVTFTAQAAATMRGETVAVSYQWQRNDGAGFVNIPNETGASYRFFPQAADMTATFRVVAGVPGKTLTSNVVKISTTTAPPEIAMQRVAGGGATTITFTGRLQSSATVSGGYQDVNGATSPYTVPAGTGTMFYRSAR